MKLNELFDLDEGLKSHERSAYNLGRSTGKAGKPMAKQETIERLMGPDTWIPYSNGYKEGQNIFKSQDKVGDERRAKIAAKTAMKVETL